MGEPYPQSEPVVAQAYLPPPGRERQPLGLPAGSVRALMVIMTMGTIWVLLLIRKPVPIFLYYLLFLTTGVYFAARGSTATRAGGPAPLYLPRGSIRLLLVAAFFGLFALGIARDPAGFLQQPLVAPTERDATLLLPLVMIGAFMMGVLSNAIARKVLSGPYGLPGWYQDVQAWLSVIAVLGLGATVILELVVFTSVENRWDMSTLQLILSAVVSFYFGARV
jgi:hypothetical protein